MTIVVLVILIIATAVRSSRRREEAVVDADASPPRHLAVGGVHVDEAADRATVSTHALAGARERHGFAPGTRGTGDVRSDGREHLVTRGVQPDE